MIKFIEKQMGASKQPLIFFTPAVSPNTECLKKWYLNFILKTYPYLS